MLPWRRSWHPIPRAGVIVLPVPPVVDELDTPVADLEGARRVLDWLAQVPLNASDAQTKEALDDAVERIRDRGRLGLEDHSSSSRSSSLECRRALPISSS